MFKFKLNDQLKKYIREVPITQSDEWTIKEYMKECTYEQDVTINRDGHELFFARMKPMFDKENKKVTISCDRGPDPKISFDIPFSWIIEGDVKFVTSYYGHRDITEKIIEVISYMIDDGLNGYKYEFIREAFEPSCNKLFKINNVFYEVYYASSSIRNSEERLTLTEIQTGDYHYVTPIEFLLGGKCRYLSCLFRDEDGLYIPELKIEEYVKVED